MLVGLLLSILAGCPQAPETAEPAPVEEVDVAMVLGDVQHLLSQAVGAHGAGDRVRAERSWEVAYDLFRTHLVHRVRDRDPERALALEYRLGRLRDELASRNGRPAKLFEPLDSELAALRLMLDASP